MSDRFPRLPGRWDDLIIVWGNGSWTSHRLGAQAIAEALAVHNPVLYVDPPQSLTRSARRGVGALRQELHRPRLSLVSPGLARLSSLGPPGQTRAGIRAVTQAWMEHAVRRSVSSLGGSVRAVISGYLFCHPFGFCGERSRIFRVSDDFSAGAELGVPIRFMTSAQQRLAGAADVLACVSPSLVETWRAQGFDASLVPNGCDADRLRSARELPRPADIVVPDPIVGHSGLLGDRIDFDLLRAIAERGHSLLLVGAIHPHLDRRAVADLLERPNVQWLGHRPYSEIPSYVGAMSVGIVPYTNSAFNRASFPLKLLEYLAAGLPVVSSDLPAVRWLDTDLVRVATRPQQFAVAVDELVADPGGEAGRRSRLAFAAGHSWSNRAADYLAILERLESRAVT